MISPISSNAFATDSSPVAQSAQQNFSTILQQLQSSQTTSPTAPLQGGTPAQHIVDGSPTSPTGLQGGTPAQHIVDSSTSSSRIHGHHHIHSGAQSDSDSDSTSTSTSSLGQLSQPVQATTTSATQAYGSLQQDLQQVALNSDLLTAQASFLQDSVLSVSA